MKKIALVVCLFIGGCQVQKVEVEQRYRIEHYEVEYGNVISLNPIEYDFEGVINWDSLKEQGYEINENFELEHYEGIKVGEYQFLLENEEELVEVNITLRDTKAPKVVEVFERIEVEYGEVVDLFSLVKFKDYHAFEVLVGNGYDEHVEGEQVVVIQAIDEFQNEVRVECIVVVKEEKKEIVVSPPTVSNPTQNVVSMSLITVVNKTHFMPYDYVPPLQSIGAGHYLQPTAANAYFQMASAIVSEGIPFCIVSSYRTMQKQQSLYENYRAQYGQAYADMYSAKPRTSEHELGLAVDLSEDCRLENSGTSRLHRWLAQNAPSYGFVLRYPLGKEYRTGYAYEPWHFRYLGVDLATYLTQNGLVLEDYYGV